jgi:hypothetical protein
VLQLHRDSGGSINYQALHSHSLEDDNRLVAVFWL